MTSSTSKSFELYLFRFEASFKCFCFNFEIDFIGFEYKYFPRCLFFQFIVTWHHFKLILFTCLLLLDENFHGTQLQLIRPLIALFLHYMSEEDAYACAFRVIKNHGTYMNDSAVARKASSFTLLALVKEYKVVVFFTTLFFSRASVQFNEIVP